MFSIHWKKTNFKAQSGFQIPIRTLWDYNSFPTLPMSHVWMLGTYPDILTMMQDIGQGLSRILHLYATTVKEKFLTKCETAQICFDSLHITYSIAYKSSLCLLLYLIHVPLSSSGCQEMSSLNIIFMMQRNLARGKSKAVRKCQEMKRV